MKEVSLLGLGLLGSALGERLLAAGYLVHGYDREPTCRDRAAAAGVRVVANGPELAASSPVLITCLPDGPAVHRALFEERIAAALPAGATVIDTTTCAPHEARTLAARLAEREVECLDAPISAGVPQLLAGAAAITVGGPQETVARLRPVLEAIAPNVYHLGPAGAGVEAKLVGNLVLGLNRLALAEGVALAERLGLDSATLLACLRAGGAYSRVMDTKAERMLHARYDPPDARLRQHAKDVDLILALGMEAGVELPTSRLHAELLRRAAERGFGEADNAAIIEAIRDKD
jgi:3-hydroxyisobutyrate dehydrogenase-like beta-hydroxyacid dehydrogenase